jgi:hypothetical protein
VVNLVLHAVASVLVTLCVERSLAGHGLRAMAATAAGLLFAVHPVHAEAVANIVCRAELLSGIFWCLAFLVYTRGAGRALVPFTLHALGASVLAGERMPSPFRVQLGG